MFETFLQLRHIFSEQTMNRRARRRYARAFQYSRMRTCHHRFALPRFLEEDLVLLGLKQRFHRLCLIEVEKEEVRLECEEGEEDRRIRGEKTLTIFDKLLDVFEDRIAFVRHSSLSSLVALRRFSDQT